MKIYTVYKKNIFKILSGFLHFWTSSSQKSIHCPLEKRWKLFCSNMENGVSNNPSFHTDFKNGNLILLKIAPKKSCAKKLFCQLKIAWSHINRFIGRNFWNQNKKPNFFIPHSTIHEKSFHLIEKSICAVLSMN